MTYIEKVWVDGIDKVNAENMNRHEEAIALAVDTAETALATGGPPGPIGPMGPQGAPGIDGADSTVPGPQGPQGVQGAKGDKGDTGLTGPTGDTGPQGPQGIQGPQGVKGDTGAQGAQGTGLALKGTVPTAANLPPTGVYGDAWQAVDTGHVWVWDVTDLRWEDAGAIAGPAGPQGPAGATGGQGPAGPGVPTGGTVGQLLAKSSSVDYATGWVTPEDEVDHDEVTPAATRLVASKLLVGDAQPAFRILGSGKIEIGPGASTVPDVNLYRNAADILGTDDGFRAGAQVRAYNGGAGQIAIGDPTNAKIMFGASLDAEIVRSAADRLATPDKFDPAAINMPTKAGVPVDGDIVGGAQDGDMVINTTAKAPYVRIGGTWQAVGGGAAGSATGVVNVLDYGAVGNDSTDCTTAFRNAYLALPAGGGTILVPPGIYRGWFDIDNPAKKVRISGYGAVLKVPANEWGFYVHYGSGGDPESTIIEGFHIDAESLGADASAIGISGSDRVRIKDVVTWGGEFGIIITALATGEFCEGTHIQNCFIRYPGQAGLCFNKFGSENTSFGETVVEDVGIQMAGTAIGILIQGDIYRSHFSGVTIFQSNGNTGIKIDHNVYGVSFHGGVESFEDGTGQIGIQVGTLATNVLSSDWNVVFTGSFANKVALASGQDLNIRMGQDVRMNGTASGGRGLRAFQGMTEAYPRVEIAGGFAGGGGVMFGAGGAPDVQLYRNAAGQLETNVALKALGGIIGGSVTGDELAYAELTTDLALPQVAQASAVTVVALPSLTFDGATPIILDFHIPRIGPGATNVITSWNLWDGSTDMGAVTESQGLTMFQSGRRRFTPSAGAHTYTLRAFCQNGTATAQNAGRLPASLRAIRVNPAPPTISPGPVTAVTYGTSLPVAPSDGQEAILVDSLTNPTYQWRFRYNAGSSSAYKWEFVGGFPMTHEIAAAQSVSGTSYTNSATVGPTLTTPRAGEYLAEYGSAGVGFGGNDVAWMSPSFAGSTPLDVDAAHGRSYATGGDAHGLRGGRIFTLAAGINITMKYRSFAGPSTFGPDRYLRLTPRRVS